MGWGGKIAGRRLRLLLASSSIAALTIGGGAPSAIACAINDVGASVGPVTNSGPINCIFIQNSTVSGDVTNAGGGTITTAPPSKVGITIDNSTIAGSVVNAGQIAASAQGIWVTNNAAVGGAVSNSGSITVTGTVGPSGLAGNGVLVGSTSQNQAITMSTFAGGISNSGTIIATGPVNSQLVGVSVQGVSTFGGGIANSGTINANARAIQVGPVPTFIGGITNQGRLTAGSDAIVVSDFSHGTGRFFGGISNSGTINAGGDGMFLIFLSTFAGGVANSGTIASGLEAITAAGISTFSGGISNSGSILAFGQGIFATGNATFGGGITNSGTIAAGQNGILVEDEITFAGGVSNAGTILATNNGAAILVQNVFRFSGGIINSGALAASSHGIWVGGNPFVSFVISTFAGDISNAGTIASGQNGIFVGSAVGGNRSFVISTFLGGISNSGTISAAANGIVVGGTAQSTAHITISTFAGGISNSGTISAASNGIWAGGGVGGAGASVTISTFAGGISNGGLITVTGTATPFGLVGNGILVGSTLQTLAPTVSTFGGGISNSGTIIATGPVSLLTGVTVRGVSTFGGGIANSGTINAYDRAIGVFNDPTFAGGITNQGALIATNTAVVVFGSPSPTQRFSGGISNSGTIAAGNDAVAVTLLSTFAGGIANSGSIASTSETGIIVAVRTFSGGITNSGSISAPRNGIFATGEASFDGGIANSGTIFGHNGIVVADAIVFANGISNAGTILATNNGAAIVVNDVFTFSGGITNSGALTASSHGILVGEQAQVFVTHATISTFAGDVSNTGAISAAGNGVLVGASGLAVGSTLTIGAFAGGIVNGGTIAAGVNGIWIGGQATGAGTSVMISTFAGGITNAGTITAANDGIFVGGAASGSGSMTISTFSGGISNSGTISADVGILIGAHATGGAFAMLSTFAGGVRNSGTISAQAGLSVQFVGSFANGISNQGAIVAANYGIHVGFVTGGVMSVSNFSGGISNSGAITAHTFGVWVAAASTFTGGISNSGSVVASFGDAVDIGHLSGATITTVSQFAGGVSNSGTISANRYAIGVRDVATFTDGIANSGTIVGFNGIRVANISTFSGNIGNAGSIVGNTGVFVGASVGFAGGAAIVNSGTIAGAAAAIDVSQATSAVTIDETGGLISGAIKLSANADMLNVTGGAIAGNIVGQGAADTINFALGNGAFVYGSAFGFSGINQVNVVSGTVILDGLNGATNVAVNGGVLEIGDAGHPGAVLISPNVVVNAGGTLAGNGTVDPAAVLVNSGGTLAPGTPGGFGTLAITGTLSFNPGSLYAVRVAPGAGNNSQTAVTGAVALSGNGTVVVTPTIGIYHSTVYRILTTSSGIAGQFAGLSVNGNFAGTLALDYATDPGDVDLDVSGFGLFAIPSGASQNQRNVINGINNAILGGVTLPPQFQNLANLSAAGLLNAATQLSGEAATDAEKGAFQFMTQLLGLMLDPFVDGRDTAGGGPLGFAPEPGPALPPDVAQAYAGVLKAPPATFDQRWSVWGTAFGGYNKTSGDAVIGSHDTTVRAFGFAGGMDYHVTPDSVLGFALAGGGTNWSLTQGLGGGSSDAFAAGLYGKTHFGPAYVGASFAYADHWMSTTRTALGDQLTARFNGQSVGARLEGGYRYGLFGAGAIGLTPYAAVQAQAFRTPTYNETDVTAGGFGLVYNAMTAHDIRGELGARFDERTLLYGMPLIWRARVAWAHDWASNPALGAVFQALPGSSFIVNGAAPPHDSALVSTGAELRVRPDWSFSARFDGEFASGAQTYSGVGIVRYSW